jgi:hypothetical protein
MTKNKTWLCPLCSKETTYGEMGCDDPNECDEPKNSNAHLYLSEIPRHEGQSIGIAEIANQEEENSGD